ncbi:MAG: murein transglycosylase A [Alphaproteobacteria bacterium]
MFGVALCAALAGCAVAPEPSGRATLTPADFADLTGWDRDDGIAAAARAFALGCTRLQKRKRWAAPCRAVAAGPPANARTARRFFERWFRPHAVTDSAAAVDGLFTGYYEPSLRGALKPDARYRIPLFARPADLITADLGSFDPALKGRRITGRVSDGKLTPYPARAEIDRGALGENGRPLVWVDDPVDAFFLHVQGSGRVTLRDGSVMRVGFAAVNGRTYTAIGRVLVARGALASGSVTMKSIRAWLAAHPKRGASVMAENARYVFFRGLSGPGPVGALGAPLTAGRSLAVDRAAIPLGAPVWLETTDALEPDQKLRRLMVAQDTGAAIKGAVRGDVFFGAGRLAARRAGAMKQPGRYFVLLPRRR